MGWRVFAYEEDAMEFMLALPMSFEAAIHRRVGKNRIIFSVRWTEVE